MIFNSAPFLVFLVVVYALYWLLQRRAQNLLLLLASYVFYAWWDWRFLSLILFSTLVDFFMGKLLDRTEASGWRRFCLGLSLVTNLGLLATFKYFNFFGESFAELLNTFGLHATYTTLNIILPIGISFYTFQTLGYTIDVYRRQRAAHHDLIEFCAFVAFFPQLVAGPIERSTNLLSQFANPRTFDPEKAKDGLRQMLWGYFQKVVVADGLASYVNNAFADPLQGGNLLLAGYFFALQIYCDFAGYSNIAIGCARLFGFNLMRNFAYPYFSRRIAEFYQRWHISLSTWFRDYLYIPLGGNRASLGRIILNVMLTFTISGLWHGANWTFVLWGFYNGLLFIPSLVRRHTRLPSPRTLTPTPSWRDLPAILLTFHLVLFGWLIFRAENLAHLGQILTTIFGQFDLAYFLRDGLKWKLTLLGFLGVEWIQRNRAHPLEIAHLPLPVRWAIYNALGLGIILLGQFNYTPFIYFQF